MRDGATSSAAVRRGRAGSLLAALLLVAGCGGAATPSAAGSAPTRPVGLTLFPVGERQLAPELAGTGLDGRPLSLGEVRRGRIVFVNVWASWCSPCRDESPLLARSATTLVPRGVRFLGLDESDRPAAARAFVAATGTTYPHLVDQDGSLLLKLRMLPQSGIPSTLVIDRRGRIAARVIGRMNESDIRRILGHLEATA